MRASTHQRLGLAALSLLLLAALTWRLTDAPPWIDEGIHNTAAATLARTGVYGLPLLDRIVAFDPAVGVGPTVVVPIAIAMKGGGVEPIVGRAVVAVYAVVAWSLMWGLLTRLGSRRAALTSLAFVLVGTHEPFQSFAFVGRQVIGEMPALAFCVAGYLALAWRAERPTRPWCAVVAGLCFGAALITKGQLVFVLLPAIGLGWIVDRAWHRHWAWWVLPVAAAAAVACYAAWTAVQIVAVGSEQYAANAAVLRLGLQTQVLAFDPAFARRAVAALLRAGFVPFGLVGLVHAALAARHRTPAGALHAQLLAFCLTATAWFLTGSIGWARYGFYATSVALLWWGGGVEALGARLAARAGSPWPGRGLLAVTLLGAVVAAAPAWREILAPEDRGYAAVTSWIVGNVAPGSTVETWEAELMLDDRLRFSYPGLRTMYEATSIVMGGRSAPRSLDYAPLHASPQWLVQGRFGGWTGVYSKVIASGPLTKVVQFGEYAVYRVEAVANGQ
jgi:4-amino-4-deoxy-L-arabinose transferase-like glycosyltransferase